MDNAEMDAFVERVEQGSDIVDVVSQYVTLKRKGNGALAVCSNYGKLWLPFFCARCSFQGAIIHKKRTVIC